MSKKVYELAKELEMESKELLEKINTMGIEAKSHNSVLSDMDAKAVGNMILHNRKKASETKIVHAATTGGNKSANEEVKIAVRQADIVAMKAKERSESKGRPEPKPAQTRPAGIAAPPKGVPVPRATSSATPHPPQGTPLPRSASMQPPTGTPLPKSASMQPPIGTPLPKSASLQPAREKEEVVIQKESAEPTKAPVQDQPTPKAPTEPVAAPIETIHKEEVKPAAKVEAPSQTTTPAEATPKREQPTGTYENRRPAYPERSGDRDSRNSDQRRSYGEGSRPPYSGGPRQGTSTDGPRPGTSTGGQGSRPPYSGGSRPGAPSGGQGNRPPYSGGSRPGAPSGGQGNRPPYSGGPRPGAPTGDRPVSPRQKLTPSDPAASGLKKGKKDRPDTEKKDKIDGKRDARKPYGSQPRSMEKPQAKKPKRKVDKTVEPETRINIEELAPGTKIINVPITVKGLSEQIEKTSSDVIMALMKLGIMANVNQNLDEDTVVLLGESLGVSIVIDKVSEEIVEEGLENFEDNEGDLQARPPIITVMGHVDHGKTSLLDAIRKTNVTATESGGITQHIGASEVTINGQRIVFLDTPGHEAFTTMRARGAHVTDIAVLVVAADDSVKPQTIESISHAKAAGVPIIVAINKMDKEGANPDRVKQDLANLPENSVLVEEYGGETISVPVSAKTGEGVVNLLEMILLQAEVLELKANPNRLAMGTVIEARLDKAKGPVATILVQNGTLQAGMSIVAGTCSGRIRAMTNDKGEKIRKAGPATAVEILGLTDVPEAGDEFNAVREDKVAREIAEQRKLKVREEIMVRNSSVTLEQLFSQIQAGEIKELNLIVKADVQGSVGALTQSLEKLQNENVKVRIIHAGVGTITESDIMLANTSNAIIIGFNVRPSTNITAMAEREKVEIRTYRVIYEIIDDIEAAMKGMLDPVYKEVVLGKIEIRNTFKVPGVGIIGGAYVLEGKVQRNAQIRLVRDGIVIHEGKISSLKRFKDDAKEVAQGYECGIGVENYNDIKEGDIIEAFKMEEIERK